jgi:replicative DNA helicase
MIESLEFSITAHDPSVISARMDSEDAIISYLLKNPGEISEIAKYLQIECFEIKQTRVGYGALVAMANLGLAIDSVSLEIYLERIGDLGLIGGGLTIAMWAGESLVSATPTLQSIETSIDYIVEIYKRKQLLKGLKKLQPKIIDLSLSYEDLSGDAEEYLLEFLRGKNNRGGLESIEKTMKNSVDLIIQRSMDKMDGEIKGKISTGFPDIDEKTGGWQRGNLIVIAGRTSMGKSAMLQNTLLAIARDHPVALFSLEMTTQEINERFLSIDSKINSAKLRDGDLTQLDWEKLATSGEKLSKLNHWGCDNSSPDIDFIASEARKLHAKNGALGGIAIDHVGLMIKNHDNPRADINRITSKSKALAMELDCPVFLVSQMNRAAEGRNDKRPQLADLAESGRLEQDANVVVMLYRDEYYTPESTDKGIAEIIIRKNRGGACGTTKLIFEAETTTFKSILKKY